MQDQIINIVGRVLIPFIVVYGLYIIFYGDVSPGGGFAGGVVVAAGFIFFRLAFADSPEIEKMPWFSKIAFYLEQKQYLLFAVIGVFSFLIALTFLAVIFPLEIIGFLAPNFKLGIGFMVALSVVIIFYTLTKGD